MHNFRAAIPNFLKSGFQMRLGDVFVTADAECMIEFKAQEVFETLLNSQVSDTKPFMFIVPDGVIYIERVIDNTVIIETNETPIVVSEIITDGQIAGKNREPVNEVKLRGNRFE